MSCDPRKRIWSMAFSVHPPPAEPWIRRALTVSRTALGTCRAIVSLASLIGPQVPVADEQRNRKRRHARPLFSSVRRYKPTKPTRPIAMRASVDGPGTRVHVPSIPVAVYPQKGSRKSLSGPQFGAAPSASNCHVPSAKEWKNDVWVLMKPSASPEDAGNFRLKPLSSKKSWEMVSDPP